MKFNIGDKVRVKESLKLGDNFGGLFPTSSMLELKGRIFTICDSDVDDDNTESYQLEEDELKFYWSPEMLEPIVNIPHIKDSGDRTEYETGAVRDLKEGKGRCDLMPLDVVAMVCDQDEIIVRISKFKERGDVSELVLALQEFYIQAYEDSPYKMVLDLSKHFEEGALKYGEGNWQKGIPVHSYIDSAIRHYLKYRAGWNDEPHDRAFVWNLVCCIWTMEHMWKLDDFTIKEEKQND